MYLEIVIIDILEPDGTLRTYKIKPKSENERVVIDRLKDIYPKKYNDELDIGGTRIYNSSKCVIERQTVKLRNFSHTNDEIKFKFEHLGIPITHGGIYNFALSANFRLTDLYIVDPYDKDHDDIRLKRHFSYNVTWDNECSVQLVEMELHSRSSSFSFILEGAAKLYSNQVDEEFIISDESEWAVAKLIDSHILDKEGEKTLSTDIAEKSDWLELKPNIFGIGINLNKIIKDSISRFKEKVNKQ